MFFSGASALSNAHLIRLTNLLSETSRGHYDKAAVLIRKNARKSNCFHMPAKSLELKQTIRLLRELDAEIDEIKIWIKSIMDEINFPIVSISSISYHMDAITIAEIGNFSRFAFPDKILSSSTYQSGQLDNCHSHMERRGSRYPRYALFYAAIFHAAKKLVKVIYQLEKSGPPYIKTT